MGLPKMDLLEVPTVCRLAMFLMALLAALAGTPLRQAEAADDLARTVAEADSGDYDIEDVDGGVGDDAGETVLKAGAGDHAAPDAFAWESVDALILPPAPPPTGLGERGRDDRAGPSPAGSARRQAWLQRFLF